MTIASPPRWLCAQASKGRRQDASDMGGDTGDTA